MFGMYVVQFFFLHFLEKLRQQNKEVCFWKSLNLFYFCLNLTIMRVAISFQRVDI